MSNAEEKGKCRKCEIDGRMKGGVEWKGGVENDKDGGAPKYPFLCMYHAFNDKSRTSWTHAWALELSNLAK